MTIANVEELANYIKEQSDIDEHFVIAISGFGGAGKSTISKRLASLLSDATLIHTDDFIASDENGAFEGYHLDWDKLEGQVINIAKTGSKLKSRIYDWRTNRPVNKEITSSKYIIIEGSIWLIQDKFKPYIDLTVWVNVPQNIANARGKKRDNDEYGVNHDKLWDEVWGPREKDSFNKLQPDKKANVLLENNYL